MATETKLRQLADKECPVYYFYSSERAHRWHSVWHLAIWSH